MRRIVHYNNEGWITGTSTIYNEGEGPGIGEILATILYGLIAFGALVYVYKIFAPFIK